MSKGNKPKHPEHLYNPKDTARVREILLKEQGGVCLLTRKPIPKGKEALDHNHKTQFVRGVLHTHSNVMLGKIENAWDRYMAWWCPISLPEFLRHTANFLEREQPKDYIHPMFIKKLETEFKKLREPKKDLMLSKYSDVVCSNAGERLKEFKKLILKRDKSYSEWQKEIDKYKEKG